MALSALAGLLVAAPSRACWDEAAARYGLSSHLFYAIARTESGLNPAAVGRNRDGARDIGLMQINSSWLPTLARHGIAEHHLFDACTSIHVGAWVLAGNVSRLGYTWEAVGAYDGLLPRPAHAQRHPEKGRAIARHCAGGRIIPTQSSQVVSSSRHT
jgi:soluble lytic murein transglycosylase-like protein